MVSVDRSDYVFVKRPGTADQFERRSIFVAIEKNDIVIGAEPSPDHRGLVPGEEVVTNGSLILEQMYEDAIMSEGGLLASRPGESEVDPLNQSRMVISQGPAGRR
jgi:cobalt-zinc-cadmium efflux system membrane fusion protein